MKVIFWKNLRTFLSLRRLYFWKNPIKKVKFDFRNNPIRKVKFDFQNHPIKKLKFDLQIIYFESQISLEDPKIRVILKVNLYTFFLSE